MKLLIRWTISALALFSAAWLLPGIYVEDSRGWVAYAAMAIVLGLANAFVRPLLKLLTCPFVLLTLGLFTLVINALTLLIASSVANNIFDIGFYVDGFWPALWGALIVSVITVILTAVVKDDDDDERSHSSKPHGRRD